MTKNMNISARLGISLGMAAALTSCFGGPSGSTSNPFSSSAASSQPGVIENVQIGDAPAIAPTTVGAASGTSSVVVVNNGTSSVIFSGRWFTSGSNFSIVGGTCGSSTTLNAGASCTIQVVFAPTDVGPKSDVLNFSYIENTNVKTATRAIAGTGITPASLSFAYELGPSVAAGGGSATTTYYVTNTGQSLAIISNRSLTLGTYFSISGGTCTNGAVIQPNGGTCTVNVTFTPTNTGYKTDDLKISYHDGAITKDATNTVSGTGLTSALLVASNTNLGNAAVNGTPGGGTVTLTNSGQTNAVITSRSLTSTAEFQFIGGTCAVGATVPAGGTCSLIMSFTPTASGARSAGLSIGYNDGTGVVNSLATLTGTGNGPAVFSASSGVIAETTVGNTTSAVVTVSNTGQSNGVVKSVSLGATTQYSIASRTCTDNLTLAPAATCTVTVNFTPTSAATHTATVAVQYNNGLIDTYVNHGLSATAVAPPPVSASNLTAVWTNDGGDKITKDERRATTSASAVINSVWDGTKTKLFGAKNEVVNFNMILENGSATDATNVSVTFNELTGPGGFKISSAPVTGNGVFNFVGRNIELFYIRYLQIKGLSRLSYETYDERHVPKRMRRPWTGSGTATGTWLDRPDRDKFYPEIAVPAESVPTFTVSSNTNQSIWCDVYIPKTAPSGVYTGTVSIREAGNLTKTIPVELTVKNFALPDVPNSKTMVNLGYGDVAKRYTGVKYPTAGSSQDTLTKAIRDRHFQIAHRHKIAIIDADPGAASYSQNAPRPEWTTRLNGSLFSPASGYDGPGVNTGNGIYSIGTYGTWSWKTGTETDMRNRTDIWENWFTANFPQTDRFLYLIDESTNFTQTETWASWVKNNPGPGGNLKTLATINLLNAVSYVPSLNIATSWFTVGDTTSWNNAFASWNAGTNKHLWMYNGKRPSNGSFATEDDGVALRELSWAQYKKGVKRWFFWESTYYNDYQGGRGETNVFQTAATFSGAFTQSSITGESGWNHSNGDGVLFYPGTDTVYPTESYNLQGPIASLRLKHWRRGIQDVDYITLAYAKNPTATTAIVNQMVPKAMWDYGISNSADPTWVRTDISWSINPNDWETARAQLSAIIEAP